jgi:hypothetical protein
MKFVVFAVLCLGISAVDPEKKDQEESQNHVSKGQKDGVDSETAKKFDDLAKHTRNVTSRWKRYPHRQNRSNETAAALRGQYQGYVDAQNHSFCGRKIPMKFRHLWMVKPQTESDILGPPQKRSFNLWAATRVGSALQKSAALRGTDSLKHPGEDSYAKSGSGSEQTLAEGGATGKVAGQEAFSTVLKDGYWPVGCYTDKMLTTGDKFGIEKDKYINSADVSIANYADLVDDADKKPMTPTVCFEFCSTLPDMVFFGVTEGRRCYCSPYFASGPGDGSKCDAVCEGDTTLMCGNTAGRSSVFEMHLCDDK